ncbi:MAG TPA: NifU family protein [Acidimicrobiales bacterium]|nr:NifU family protein [Acidimicrobiales bacterium]
MDATDTAAAPAPDAEVPAAAPTAADTPEADLVLRLTDTALATVASLRDAEDDAEALALRVEVTGVRGTEFSYDLAFEAAAGAAPDDAVTVQAGVTVWIPAGSVDRLKGATLDVPSREGQGGLVLRNPNRPDPLGMDGSIELVGTVEERVTQLLDQHINPALASHGGFASLVEVEGSAAHITMGGGCQGCAVSAMTLRDGIQSAILERVPEITEVIDTTDHDAGENPFFTDNPYE